MLSPLIQSITAHCHSAKAILLFSLVLTGYMYVLCKADYFKEGVFFVVTSILVARE